MVSVGRPAESLALLKPLETGTQASPYGAMWVAATRTCAFYALGQTQEAIQAKAYVSAHAADNASAVINTALCANDLDAAAAAIIAQLENPETRSDTLFRLSRYKQAKLTPNGIELSRRIEALRVRVDIQAAVARVGRLETVPLFGGPLGAGF